MNKRIFTELYKKTWGHFPCPTGEPELEKFAELIVQECANVANGGWADPGHQIKQHFGVEE